MVEEKVATENGELVGGMRLAELVVVGRRRFLFPFFPFLNSFGRNISFSFFSYFYLF